MDMKELKKLAFSGLMATASLTGMAQSLEKMQWFNEPAQWEIDGNTLIMDVTPPDRLLAHIPLWFYRGRCPLPVYPAWRRV